MSDLSKKYNIEELLRRKLGNLEQDPSEDYWNAIDKGVSKGMFYKFGWKHLNIYYLSASILVMALGVLLISFSKNNNSPTSSPGTKSIGASIDTINVDAGNPTILNKNNSKLEVEKQVIKSTTMEPSLVEEQVIDSSKATPVKMEEKNTPTIEPEKKALPRKKFYIIQTDTIIEQDTLKIKKRRKKTND